MLASFCKRAAPNILPTIRQITFPIGHNGHHYPHKRQKEKHRTWTRYGAFWWRLPGSNRWPLACHASALPAELNPQMCCCRLTTCYIIATKTAVVNRFWQKSLGDFEKTARQGNESKETNNKPRKYARYKTTKSTARKQSWQCSVKGQNK